MSSDHFNFHIQKLVELGLVEKVARGTYALTPRGKEHANKLDTDNNTIERQPKVAVILCAERKNSKGQKEYLFQERLKHPYFGFWGLPTGKIRWGETIVQCAARELMEETGLTADHKISGVYHELVYQQETGDQLEDKIFFVVRCTKTAGKLLTKFEGGRNKWMTRADALKQPKVFTSFDIEIDIVNAKDVFVERSVEYTKDLF
ncbi:NUDIX domain-containing protein [Candidatus Saccharibacteria bacterium]|nr:NUDIX domain-containing protein [Candidatus Saccharibacteria bacterium]